MKIIRFNYKQGKNFESLLQELSLVLKSFFSPYYEQVQINYETRDVRDYLIKVTLYYKYLVKDRVMWGGYYQVMNREVAGKLTEFNYVIGKNAITIYYQEDSVFTPLLLIALTKIANRIQIIDGWYDVESDVVKPASEEVLLQGNIISELIYNRLLEASIEAKEKILSLPVFINDTTFISIFTQPNIQPPENPLKLFEIKAELYILMNRVQIMLDLFNIAEELKKRRKMTFLTLDFSKRLTEEERRVGLFIDTSDLSLMEEE